jgi:hypothetical protein
MKDNKYYVKMENLISHAVSAFDDGKVTITEIWAFFLLLGDTIASVIGEASHWDSKDTADVKSAAVELYKQFVEPLDLPGPDFVIDPLFRDVMIPGLVEGAVRLAKAKDVTAYKKFSD